MSARHFATIGCIALCAGLLPPLAAAQNSPAPAMQITQIENGFVVAPDVRFTEVNDRSATLVGVNGGWLTARTLLVGAGGYWLANRDDGFKMQYGGGLIRWTFGGDRTVGVSTGVLLGGGSATLTRTYGDLFGIPAGTTVVSSSRNAHEHSGSGGAVTSETRVRVDDDFLIAEPQVSALWRITPWLRLDGGVGYRFIGASDLLGHQLRGPCATIGLQFGGR